MLATVRHQNIPNPNTNITVYTFHFTFKLGAYRIWGTASFDFISIFSIGNCEIYCSYTLKEFLQKSIRFRVLRINRCYVCGPCHFGIFRQNWYIYFVIGWLEMEFGLELKRRYAHWKPLFAIVLISRSRMPFTFLLFERWMRV